jgi:putative PIN family toxin of toxin-antitoxin system
MKPHKIVLDTNVIVSALRSSEGASHSLLMALDDPRLKVYLSVTLVLEYESVLKRSSTGIRLNSAEKDAVLDHLCQVGIRQKVHFLWRPFLKDPSDDMVLELAVAAGADKIVTFNQVDFKGVEKFGIRAVRPQDILKLLGDIS